MKRRTSHEYHIPRLTKTEYATLRWLADRGYDGGILDAAGVEEEFDDGSALLGGVSESAAWMIKEAIDDDPHAFLSSCGSASLSEKLWNFVERIV